MSEQMEKLIAQKEQKAAEIKKKQNDLKSLDKKIANLSRKERTHRLCQRAGMLESFLKEPELLTDDDVYQLLEFIFSIEDVQAMLKQLLKARRESESSEVTE